MIDTHAHIYSKKFEGQTAQMIERAKEAKITQILMPNIDHESIDSMLELEQKHPDFCQAMMGLHPCHVKKNFEKELYIVEDWLSKRSFIAVGEMGLDFYWDTSFKEQQIEAFKIQAEFSIKNEIPLVIHARESMNEVIGLLQTLKTDKLKGVMHCFTGNLNQAEQLIELDFMLGIGGVVTFKNGGLDKVIPHIETKHLLLETDSPYLAPKPYRGKTNEPSYLPYIANKIAELKSQKIEDIIQQTTSNANQLFNLKCIEKTF